MSGTEILIILVVGIIVVGPKKLPGMMRTAGRWVAKARRMTTEVRAQSGIDRLIREEGLENEIRELSSLTRSNVLSSLANPLISAQREVTSFARAPLAASAAKDATDTKKPTTAATADASAAVETSDTGSVRTPKSALDLVKPAAGAVSRKPTDAEAGTADVAAGGAKGKHDQALRALVASGLFSIREREYPTIGCDAYDCLPDDIDDPEAYANEAEEPTIMPPPAPAEAAPAESKESA